MRAAMKQFSLTITDNDKFLLRLTTYDESEERYKTLWFGAFDTMEEALQTAYDAFSNGIPESVE